MEGTGVVPVMNMNHGYDNDWGNGCGMCSCGLLLFLP